MSPTLVQSADKPFTTSIYHQEPASLITQLISAAHIVQPITQRAQDIPASTEDHQAALIKLQRTAAELISNYEASAYRMTSP